MAHVATSEYQGDDITAIRGQSQTLQAMIDNFPGGLALIDRELTLIASNKLYRTLLAARSK